jgi:hydroxymethylbilane synthase
VTLRIGTRGSALALAQTRGVADALTAAGARVEIVTVATAGDRSAGPIAEIGVGVFTSALRDALAAGEIDVAVHSYKDLPTKPDPRFSAPAVPIREDPRDALVARDGRALADLGPGAVIGTGSPRRAAQLRALGFGFCVTGLRGNVDTRIRKVAEGQLDAVVLAAAGLRRIGRLDEVSELLDPMRMVPAPAQGALAVECRADEMDTEHLLAGALGHEPSRQAVTAERTVLAVLEAGCTAPVGALAEVMADPDAAGATASRLSLCAVAADSHGGLLRATGRADLAEPQRLGADLAEELLESGATVPSGPTR